MGLELKNNQMQLERQPRVKLLKILMILRVRLLKETTMLKNVKILEALKSRKSEIQMKMKNKVVYNRRYPKKKELIGKTMK